MSRAHKFKVGQHVIFRPPSLRLHGRTVGRRVAPEDYEIVRLLPADGPDFQYRIKGGEGQERVAVEGDLTPADSLG